MSPLPGHPGKCHIRDSPRESANTREESTATPRYASENPRLPLKGDLPRHRLSSRFTEWSGLAGTSVGHPVQPPAEAGSPTVGCRGPCPGGSGISAEISGASSPALHPQSSGIPAAAPGICHIHPESRCRWAITALLSFPPRCWQPGAAHQVPFPARSQACWANWDHLAAYLPYLSQPAEMQAAPRGVKWLVNTGKLL